MNKKEIVHLATNIYEEALTAASYWHIINQYHVNIQKYNDEMNYSPAFYQVIYQALVESLFMNLAKVYDSDNESLTIRTLLSEMKMVSAENFAECVGETYSFCGSKFLHRLKPEEECFFKKEVAETHSICEALGIDYIFTEMELSFEDLIVFYTKKLHSINPSIKNLINQRNKIYAHNDRKTKFDTIDMEIGFLEENFAIDYDNDKFHLGFIGRIIKEYQKLFPYLHFLSRENIIKSEECSICGAPISLRNRCGHKPGKLYMGELCLRKVTNMEFKAMAIVTDPFDKYAYITIPDKEYDYGMLDWLMTYVKSPYDSFSIETKKEKKPEYIKVGRNDPCPCGSGKKYKKCHLGTDSELMDHHVVHMAGTKEQQTKEIRYFGTWK